MPRKSRTTSSKLPSFPKTPSLPKLPQMKRMPKMKSFNPTPRSSTRITYRPQRCQIDPPEQWDSEVEATLAQAITDRTCLSGSYDGAPIRHFCPNELGQTKAGYRNVLVYQHDGYSRSGLEDGQPHRCMRVSNLSDLRPEAGAWPEVAGDHDNETCVLWPEVTAFDVSPCDRGRR